MKKVLLCIVLVCLSGCSLFRQRPDLNEEAKPEYSPPQSLINESGNTLEMRISAPEGYFRTQEEPGSFLMYLRGLQMKEHNSPVLLYDGSEKVNQSAHAAVFDFPLENADLQQCADSVMRVFAEYYWETGQFDKIAFHFTDGFLCEYSKWREGYRVAFSGGKTLWKKSAAYDDSYESFIKYMKIVFSYAGTASMEMYESKAILLSEVGAGDVILKGGSPGHVVMVVDVCENDAGEKAFLLAQGYMPAQEFHIINNPAHAVDPWYYETEISFPL
ncbi:MAG: DUF4846 domain-containing protein, partial [Clostridia bacterium]|nr:DUF4846 domain-containing protein [Clostridia bacterium]